MVIDWNRVFSIFARLLIVGMFCLSSGLVVFNQEDLILAEKIAAVLFLTTLFLSGVISRGRANSRFVCLIIFSYIIAYIFCALAYSLFANFPYWRAIVPLLSLIPGFVFLYFYSYLFCKIYSFSERQGKLTQKVIQRTLGELDLTNMYFCFLKYWKYYLLYDFAYFLTAVVIGLSIGTSYFGGSISAEFGAENWDKVYFIFRIIEVSLDLYLSYKLIRLSIFDLKWPDALGVGQTMTFKKSR